MLMVSSNNETIAVLYRYIHVAALGYVKRVRSILTQVRKELHWLVKIGYYLLICLIQVHRSVLFLMLLFVLICSALVRSLRLNVAPIEDGVLLVHRVGDTCAVLTARGRFMCLPLLTEGYVY